MLRSRDGLQRIMDDRVEDLGWSDVAARGFRWSISKFTPFSDAPVTMIGVSEFLSRQEHSAGSFTNVEEDAGLPHHGRQSGSRRTSSVGEDDGGLLMSSSDESGPSRRMPGILGGTAVLRAILDCPTINALTRAG